MFKSIIKTAVLAASFSIPVAAMAGSINPANQVTDFTGLGTAEQNFYGTAQINPGYNTTDGSGTLTLITGADPQTKGTVTFKLWSSPAGYPQPCVFGVGYQNDFGLQETYWPIHSQIGWYGSNAQTGEATMYFRAPDGLHPYSAYVVKYICLPKTKNPPQG